MAHDADERPPHASQGPQQPPSSSDHEGAERGGQVTGPIDNKLLCYGLLECARDAIKDFNDQRAQKSAILPARPVDPFLIRQNGHGGRTS
jgi:hypothetical protein